METRMGEFLRQGRESTNGPIVPHAPEKTFTLVQLVVTNNPPPRHEQSGGNPRNEWVVAKWKRDGVR